jgi:hypothetical protein
MKIINKTTGEEWDFVSDDFKSAVNEILNTVQYNNKQYNENCVVKESDLIVKEI